MEQRSFAQVVCSSLSLLCLCLQTVFHVRSAVGLEREDRMQPTGLDQLRAPPYILRAKQALPIIAAMSGLAYCGCNLILRIEDGIDAVGFLDREPVPQAEKDLGVRDSGHPGLCDVLQREHHFGGTGLCHLGGELEANRRVSLMRHHGIQHCLHHATILCTQI